MNGQISPHKRPPCAAFPPASYTVNIPMCFDPVSSSFSRKALNPRWADATLGPKWGDKGQVLSLSNLQKRGTGKHCGAMVRVTAFLPPRLITPGRSPWRPRAIQLSREWNCILVPRDTVNMVGGSEGCLQDADESLEGKRGLSWPKAFADQALALSLLEDKGCSLWESHLSPAYSSTDSLYCTHVSFSVYLRLVIWSLLTEERLLPNMASF